MNDSWRLAALQTKLEHALARARAALLVLQRRQREAESAIAELARERLLEERALAAQARRALDPAQRIASLRYLLARDTELRARRAALAALEQQVAAATGELNTLQRRLETLEALHREAEQLRTRALERAAHRTADLEWLARAARADRCEERVAC